jgi:hypothetical protein
MRTKSWSSSPRTLCNFAAMLWNDEPIGVNTGRCVATQVRGDADVAFDVR